MKKMKKMEKIKKITKELRNKTCSAIKKRIASKGLRKTLVEHEHKISVDGFGKIFIDLNNVESRKALKEKIDEISEVKLS
ncbi:TPA: hypothetical protein NJ528_004455 [Vibrio parahaemolyticus]|uniref:hypothetical protein n=1 Tax=Vibrio parahaemolyticus TaxID=670 RepID=UPI003296B488|nr:hypothetical protein [Vibrio parahaemolyticus]HCE4653442.1 hypothetical protein [Vibrio parahaemolyticus]HCG6540058.1 hypothetical protein [Vibrio parahaemolyticus]HCG8290468.1 hypothetical protein [Vibrio parahaemolyticus]HCG8295658.1 hypothetical protein [Vibrio parahaemolyticus]